MTNNQILINQLVEQEYNDQSQYDDKATFFEFLASSKVMTQYDLDDDEIENGVLGGALDGGCDSIYVLCNELLLGEDASIESVIRRGSRIEIVIIQCKTSKSFTEDVFLKWKDACNDLLDYNVPIDSLDGKYSEQVLEAFTRIREAIKTASLKGAQAMMRFVYVANAGQPSNGVLRQSDELVEYAKQKVNANSFSVQADLVGADQLMEMWFPPDESALCIKFSGPYASVPERSDFFDLVSLSDFHNFLVDDKGRLRSYLLEANIRDYEGNVAVNKAIRNTLDNPSGEDFWWLNNGVTILASSAVQATGSVVRMEEPRIVNGLQTTYEIYGYMQRRSSDDPDNRQVMVRILIPDNDATRSKVIMATNSQTSVKKTSLRATDPIHHQIELYLKPKGLYYERRKNYYKNQGKKPEEIVSISFLAQCLMSIVLNQPNQARARPSTLLSDERKYDQLFRKNGELEAYYKAAAMGKSVMLRLPRVRPNLTRSEISDVRFYVLMGVAHLLVPKPKTKLDLKDLANVDLGKLSDELIGTASDTACDVYMRLGGTPATAKSSTMPNEVLKGIIMCKHMLAAQERKADGQSDVVDYASSNNANKDTDNEIASRRRPPFKFKMAGIPPESEIHFVGNDSIVCTTVGDDNKVLYDGHKYSTSRLAAILNNDPNGRYRGPEWFTYRGERLSDLRDKHEKKVDSL